MSAEAATLSGVHCNLNGVNRGRPVHVRQGCVHVHQGRLNVRLNVR